MKPKTACPASIVAAERNEEVIIARNGIPVAKLIKYPATRLPHRAHRKARLLMLPIGIPPKPIAK
ncbi:MAG: hypothetical protein Q8S55_11100 [Methylococcaceae bacterium]|nr:hypothetical protein [Methylococcaceae bacterium]